MLKKSVCLTTGEQKQATDGLTSTQRVNLYIALLYILNGFIQTGNDAKH